MNNFISRLFEKRGIKDVNELTSEERATFENYEKVLSQTELTIPDLQRFLEGQIGIIESQWRANALKETEKGSLIPYHTVYNVILEALTAPQAKRAELEKYLNDLLK